jgi:hypothetical protein
MTCNETSQINSEPKPSFSLWNQLEAKQISKEELPNTLFKKLGEPSNELQANLAQELIKKIVSYYFTAETEQNHTIYSVVGWVSEIIHKRYKEGPKKGQSFYVIVLGDTKDKLHATQELLKEGQWSQITKLALLGQNLVFQYRKWFSNKQVLDYYPVAKKAKN